MKRLPMLFISSLILCACWSGKDKTETDKPEQDTAWERLRKEDSIKTERYNDSINSLYYYIDVCNVIHESRDGCLTLMQMDFDNEVSDSNDYTNSYITSSRIAGLKIVDKNDVEELKYRIEKTNLLFCKYCFRTKEYIRLMNRINKSEK